MFRFCRAAPRGRVNLYGAPLRIPEDQVIRQVTKRAATLGYSPKIDYRHQYDNFPQHASTYRGRVMIAEKIVDVLPQKHKKERVSSGFVGMMGRVCVGEGRGEPFYAMLVI